MPSNPASACGEEVGKLFEQAIVKGLGKDIKSRGYSIRPRKMKNGTNNVYQIDGVIEDKARNPVIIIDPKYIRYTKHNRDKGSWLCVAHYNLRKTYPTIRKSIAILAGRWSKPSIALIESFGVEVLLVPFSVLVEALGKHGVHFDWPESDRLGSNKAYMALCSLKKTEKTQIANDIVSEVMPLLRKEVLEVLDADISTIPQRVRQVEILLKTDRDEMLLRTFDTVSEALAFLAGLVTDKPDISAKHK
ncbi:MAG: hypothetical protein HYX90_12455 [Chloroflexi bacterium]|nr:hypothetical protein [Chloroflexota bacterium]